MQIVSCKEFIDDPYITDDCGETKGQCVNCGAKWYEHDISVLSEWDKISADMIQKKEGIEN
jgi:hypothetical protein